MPTRQEILSLYRSYLRIVREWPEDKVRPNRGMKQVLAKKVEEQFRSSSNIDYDKSVQEMKALDYLLDNRFKEKVYFGLLMKSCVGMDGRVCVCVYV